MAKKEASEKLKHNCLQTIRIAKDKIVWAESGKELIIDGELFDVKKILPAGSVLSVSGIFDKKETDLQKMAENITGKEKKDQSILLKEYFKFLSVIYFQSDIKGSEIAASATPAFSFENPSLLTDIYLNIPLPPPKI